MKLDADIAKTKGTTEAKGLIRKNPIIAAGIVVELEIKL
jgi:hypothetical protein